MIQLIKVCELPVERYLNPEIMREKSEQRQRVSHKLKLCPEEYLPIIEGAIDGRSKWNRLRSRRRTHIGYFRRHAERPAKRRNGIAEATPFPQNILMLFYECCPKGQVHDLLFAAASRLLYSVTTR